MKFSAFLLTFSPFLVRGKVNVPSFLVALATNLGFYDAISQVSQLCMHVQSLTESIKPPQQEGLLQTVVLGVVFTQRVTISCGLYLLVMETYIVLSEKKHSCILMDF